MSDGYTIPDAIWNRTFRALLDTAKLHNVPWTWETRAFILHQTDMLSGALAGVNYYGFAHAPENQ